MDFGNKKILIAYFSRGGQNYCGGKIMNLAVGNTEKAAKMLAKITGGELFEIKPQRSYPFSYNECTAEAKLELSGGTRPALVGDIAAESYDVIFLCYPNWWGTMPMAVWTFLEKHKLGGKTICPLCTNEGSGMGLSEEDLSKLCKTSEIKRGLAIIGSKVENSENEIKRWVEKL